MHNTALGGKRSKIFNYTLNDKYSDKGLKNRGFKSVTFFEVQEHLSVPSNQTQKQLSLRN